MKKSLNKDLKFNIALKVITIAVLITVFLVYSYSIFHDRLFLGTGDRSVRFLIAMNYARDPSKAFSWEAWLSVWPPVPFIIQGFILRLVLFPGMSDASTGLMAVQLTSVVLVLLGFWLIGRSVALQTNEPTGLLACLMCFCAPTLLYLAHTTSSEVYSFFFISLAIWNLFRLINQNKGLVWLVLSFVLAFFCRSESLILIPLAVAFLLAHRRWRSVALLVGTIIALALGKLLGSILLVEGTKFFEYGKNYSWGNTWQSRLSIACELLRQFGSHNRKFILLSFVCLIPLTYYFVKLRNFSEFVQVGNEQNVTQESSSVTTKMKGFFVGLTKAYDQICLWVVNFPVIFWAAAFLITLGILIQQALQGNINSQWRYLYLSNVFMTTVIALFVAQGIGTIYRARGRKFAKRMVLGIVSVLLLFSLWSGLSHATGLNVFWKMSSSMKDVIEFIREHEAQGDQVAYDFLKWQGSAIAVKLLNPSPIVPNQFTYGGNDENLISLMPKKFQWPSEKKEKNTALIHAFIHAKHPRFLVLASEQFYEAIQKNMDGVSISQNIKPIRGYLRPLEAAKSEFVFQSPYVFPEVKLQFTKVHENKDFIILERKTVSSKKGSALPNLQC